MLISSLKQNQTLDDDGPCKGETFVGGDDLNIVEVLSVMSVFVFAFSCQVTTFPICNELENPTKKRLSSTWLASIISAGTYRYGYISTF